MSTHPNTILLGIITPDDLARKTYRDICAEVGADPSDAYFTINDSDKRHYSMTVMESHYDDDSQISAPEGSIVIWTFLTYGYGETISWEEADAERVRVADWLTKICAKHKCTYSIQLTANYR